MDSEDISNKLSQLKDLKKKDKAQIKPFTYKKSRKSPNFSNIQSGKKISDYESTEYEDDILEDSENIKEKRDKAYEENLENWITKKRELIKDLKQKKEIEKIININTFFPYKNIRESQKDLIQDIHLALNSQKNIIAHAPTGLGKTIASLGPALEYAIRAKKTVLFLTSRQTQHMIAIKTLKEINEEFGIEINCLDIIGKKWMCLQQGIEMINGGDFSEFCRNAKKERTCEYYNNMRKSDGMIKIPAEVYVSEIKNSILNTEELVESCKSHRFCPYEIGLVKGETAQVIVSDYSYVFHPHIREIFFRKLGLNLSDCVIVIDEAHNLPDRTKDSASAQLTTSMLQRALKEASKYDLEEAVTVIRNLYDKIVEFKPDTGSQRFVADKAALIEKKTINDMITSTLNLEATCAVLDKAIETVRENQKKSAISPLLNFIVAWQGIEEGFTRIFSNDSNKVDGKVIRYACLDPSIMTKKIFDECESAVLISGTLKPTSMYRDLLGVSRVIEKEYKNPFPEDNALQLIIPKTTTKYDRRTEEEFQNIAKECKNLLELVPGNTVIFFSSYDIRNKVYKYLYDEEEHFILEEPSLNKEEKAEIIKEFMTSSLKRKVLLGASSGSFGEGIDFPGHFLTCVIVVGLPLMKPTLEVNKLIDYYNSKFKKGWDYGYFYPSFNKTFQNVGRCIRSETDRGIMIYLDERFSEDRYLKFFEGRKYEVLLDYEQKIKEFKF